MIQTFTGGYRTTAGDAKMNMKAKRREKEDFVPELGTFGIFASFQ